MNVDVQIKRIELTQDKTDMVLKELRQINLLKEKLKNLKELEFELQREKDQMLSAKKKICKKKQMTQVEFRRQLYKRDKPKWDKKKDIDLSKPSNSDKQ
mmetsp:Transcript_16587/g.28239  ORF Transcript_16587/g.28239 Transcript_16587/m.28239 type:complete len:99 (+) Transcript_16587:694-990(+)